MIDSLARVHLLQTDEWTERWTDDIHANSLIVT